MNLHRDCMVIIIVVGIHLTKTTKISRIICETCNGCDDADYQLKLEIKLHLSELHPDIEIINCGLVVLGVSIQV